MAYVPPHARRAQSGGDSKSSFSRQGGKTGYKPISKSTPSENSEFFLRCFDRICCINLKSRPDKWRGFLGRARSIPCLVEEKLERIEAVDGQHVLDVSSRELGTEVSLEWDTTTNSLWDRHVDPGTRRATAGEIGCALSHVALWRQLAESESDQSMLVLEDDAAFRRNNFLQAFKEAWSILPTKWDIFYLGISDRGDRSDFRRSPVHGSGSDSHLTIELFRPEYGFHTHSYSITKGAAKRLLEELPVVGPVDVWLADNNWFGMNVHCAIVANEGWKRRGSNLILQDRSHGSDIDQSGRQNI